MYACIPEIGSGFFAVVCTPSDATANFSDPPPPGNAIEPEPCQWGLRPEVDHALRYLGRRFSLG
jgi:hypothetical protein